MTNFTRHLLLMLTLALSFTPLASAAAPVAQKGNDVHDLLFLGEARPVFLRLHVQLDGKPVESAWEGFMKSLFSYLDIDGDGVLSKDEAERVPTVEQLRSGALGGAFGGGGRGGPARPTSPTMTDLDTDKDGKVTPAELAAYYRKNGFVPFQVHLSAPQGNPLGALAFLGGRGGEPSVQAVSQAIFNLLDTDKDGKLTRVKLAAAPSLLLRLDEDADEMVTTRELVPNAQPAGGMLGAIAMMRGQRPGSGSGNKLLIPITPETTDTLVGMIQERYSTAGNKSDEKKLSRKDLGLDEQTFRRLDTNADGNLDSKELAGFLKQSPDVELVVRLGKSQSDTAVELIPARELSAKVKVTEDVALLDLGVTRAEIRITEENSYNGFAGLARQQYLAQFKQADTDNVGYLEEKKVGTSRLFRNLFKAMDRDGDGKLYEKEVVAYLDEFEKLQARAKASCVSVVISDHSRGLFDLLDVNRDGRLSVREMRGAAQLLEKLDRDGKGYLTKADIPRSYQLGVRQGVPNTGAAGGAAAFAALYGGGNRSGPEREPTAGPLWFRKMDRNRDGDVSVKEFLFSKELFRQIDTDADGLISVEEAERSEAELRKKK